MKRNQFILLVVLGCVLGIMLALLLYEWYVLDVQTAPVEFKVTAGQDLGFNIDPGMMAFGKVPQGGVAERRATLQSRIAATARISATPAWVMPEENPVILEPGEQRKIRFILSVPEDAPPGNYTGEVRIVYTRRVGFI